MPSHAPSHLGPYRILDVLGHGGMGVVYRGEHTETLERVALKTVLGSDLTSIRREIHALGRLRHPGIVPVLAEGVTAEGIPWMAMSLLDGPSLADHLAGLRAAPPSSLAPTLTLIRRLCAPLAFLHGEDLVHRDLKPHNVILRDGRPVLIDLGIAAQSGGARGREALDVEMPYGSAPYMAPEQIRREPVDARADLYALGCILYECATGRPPFQGSAVDICYQHVNVRPLAPSQLVPGLPPALDQLVSRLLAKDPRDRIGHAAAVAAALAALGAEAEPDDGPAAQAYLYRSELVGREAPLSALRTAVNRLRSGGRGGMVLLQGESGAGKTRLLREIARAAAAFELPVLPGACEPPGAGKVLDPLRAVLLAAIDRSRMSRAEADRLFGPRGGVLARYMPEISRLPGQSEQPAPPALPPLDARARALSALRETVWALADATPVVVMLDDLQWADELTLGLIEALVKGGLDERRVLLVGAYRIEETGAELAALALARGVTTLTVDRLSQGQVYAMVANMLAQTEPPRGALQALADCSDGNPLFVAAYLYAAIEQGILRRDEGGSFRFEPRAGAAVSSLPLPRDLSTLLEQRIARLDGDARTLLAWAAVLGRDFGGDLLLARGAGADALRALEILRVKRILEEGQGRMRFVHDKIREIAYQKLAEDERVELHRHAGEVLEARYAGAPAMAQILGHHFAEARLHDRAARHFTRAAEHAREIYANGDAIRYFRAAIAACAHLDAPPPLAPLHEGLGDVLELIGHHDEAREAYQAALAATAPGQRLEATRIQRRIGKTLEMQHRHRQALDAYAAAEATLGEPDDADAWWREWLEIQHHRVSVHYWLADLAGVSALIEAIGPVVERRGQALERGRYLHALTQRNVQVERYLASAETVSYARACVEAFEGAEEAPEGYWSLYARTALATVLVLHDDLDEAHERMTEVLHAAQRTGDIEAQTRCLTYLTVIHRRARRIGPACDLAKRSLLLARENQVHEYVGAALGTLAWEASVRDDLMEAERMGREALASWARQPEHVYPFQWLARLPLVKVALAQDRLKDALAQARALLDVRQQRLPDPIARALAAGISARGKDGAARARQAIARAIQAARRLGYL